jgi:uncharacterized protein (TIGR03083 family)
MTAQAAVSTIPTRDALDIALLTREQSRTLAHTEVQRFVDLLMLLDDDDWDKPTACALWSVRDIAAHQASHVALGSGVWGFLSQLNPALLLPYLRRGMSGLDALNQAQVYKRKALPIADVIAELRDGTPKAIESRQRTNPLAYLIQMPISPLRFVSLDTLLHVILVRDMWMHRHDIAAATGKPFVQTADHDGPIVEQAVRDAARYAVRTLPDIAITLTLRGASGGMWQFGTGRPVHLSMDSTDFMRRTSERATVDETFGLAASDAAPDVTRRVLAVLLAPY